MSKTLDDNQIVATSQEAAERIYTRLQQCGLVPPEFEGNYVMQARLIAGIACDIAETFSGRKMQRGSGTLEKCGSAQI